MSAEAINKKCSTVIKNSTEGFSVQYIGTYQALKWNFTIASILQDSLISCFLVFFEERYIWVRL